MLMFVLEEVNVSNSILVIVLRDYTHMNGVNTQSASESLQTKLQQCALDLEIAQRQQNVNAIQDILDRCATFQVALEFCQMKHLFVQATENVT